MSISTINNTTPDAVAWANLSCNSLTCASLSSTNVPSFPTVACSLPIVFPQNMPIGGDDTDVTASGIVFDFTGNPLASESVYNISPSDISQQSPGSSFNVLAKGGLYNIIVEMRNVTVNSADAVGPVVLQAKFNNATPGFTEILIESEQVTLSDTGSGSTLKIISTVYLPFDNSTLQCNFRRTANSANPATPGQTIDLALTTYSGIKLTRVY